MRLNINLVIGIQRLSMLKLCLSDLISYEEYHKAEADISTYIYEKEHKIYGDAIRMQRPRILKDIIYEEKKEQIF